MANAQSLYLMVRTPISSAASSSSRIASQDRPTRLRSRFRTPRMTSRMMLRPSQKYGVASAYACSLASVDHSRLEIIAGADHFTIMNEMASPQGRITTCIRQLFERTA